MLILVLQVRGSTDCELPNPLGCTVVLKRSTSYHFAVVCLLCSSQTCPHAIPMYIVRDWGLFTESATAAKVTVQEIREELTHLESISMNAAFIEQKTPHLDIWCRCCRAS